MLVCLNSLFLKKVINFLETKENINKEYIQTTIRLVSMSSLKSHIVQFVVMFLLGVFFNPMNMLAYDIGHFYFSYTLIYSGILMASNMVWGHEIVHYINHGHFSRTTFIVGVAMSLFTVIVLLRGQLFVDETQWLRRMIGHHSTALTTTRKLLETQNFETKPSLYTLGKNIIYTQEKEILMMKQYLHDQTTTP